MKFIWRHLPPRAKQHLQTVSKEGGSLPEQEYQELLRRELNGPLPERRGRPRKPFEWPWIWQAYDVVKTLYERAEGDAGKVRLVLEWMKERQGPLEILDQGKLDKGFPRFFAPQDFKVDLLLKQDLEGIAMGRLTPNNFGLEVLAAAQGWRGLLGARERVRKQIKRGEQRGRA